MSAGIFVDGQPLGAVSARDRGLQFGDGVFETLAVRNGRVRLLQRHLQRLASALQHLHIAFDEWSTVRHELEAQARVNADAVLKLIVTRGSSGRGYAAPALIRARRILYVSPWPQLPSALRLRVCDTRLATGGSLAGIKHLNRLEQVMGRLETDADERADDGLMLDAGNRVIETTSANLFAVMGERIVTPALGRCGVAGVMRDVILELLERDGQPCRRVDLSLDELLAADEVFATNALIGLVPVSAIGTRRWASWPVARGLGRRLAATLESSP